MISRTAKKTLLALAQEFPVAVVTGPRQSGKTTLVENSFPKKPYISFDELDQLEMARNDPRGFLNRFPEGAIIDEAQKFPELFSYIKSRVDKNKIPGEFIITGSQQFFLMERVTESLAGRAGFVQLLPFSIDELNSAKRLPDKLDDLLFSGLYPPIYDRNITPAHWHNGYITTYIERDARAVINIKELSLFQKFLRMCAARTGQLLNISDLSRDCGISVHTARAWLSVLEASYIIFFLQPYFKNFGKRLVKTSKLYFFDPGLAAWLLNIQDVGHLAIHPSRGALFESLIATELIKQRFNKGLASNLYFWRDNLGDEIDIVLDNGATYDLIEIKSGATINQDYFKTLNKWPKISGEKTKSWLVYGGNEKNHYKDTTILPWNNLKSIGV